MSDEPRGTVAHHVRGGITRRWRVCRVAVGPGSDLGVVSPADRNCRHPDRSMGLSTTRSPTSVGPGRWLDRHSPSTASERWPRSSRGRHPPRLVSEIVETATTVTNLAPSHPPPPPSRPRPHVTLKSKQPRHSTRPHPFRPTDASGVSQPRDRATDPGHQRTGSKPLTTAATSASMANSLASARSMLSGSSSHCTCRPSITARMLADALATVTGAATP